ncbi:DNA cytosine methyltransferase [Massilia solisilvae]
MGSYYSFCNGKSDLAYDNTTREAWAASGEEACQLELGNPNDNDKLDRRINMHGLGPNSPWVLIGGPPCQAYSLVGRSRNRGNAEYKAEDDHRHFLYKEYLRIIQKYKPAVFVMENVKGILSARVGENRIFESILRDLSDPDRATGMAASGHGYRIHSISHNTSFSRGDDPSKIDVRDFVVRAENHGVPQARHRVILLGVREDIGRLPKTIPLLTPMTVGSVISSLPRLRSKLSRDPDSDENWAYLVRNHFSEMAKEIKGFKNLDELYRILVDSSREVPLGLGTGGRQLPKHGKDTVDSHQLAEWYHDPKLSVWLNHEARGHMSGDLRRYAYASAFAKAFGRSPKGHDEFFLQGLRPNHENWESGKFSDRFRVQLVGRPATTVTSHISKDGHYFIHPDPLQCRSLTVREAARLQTFPDNYFFMGNRTEQFHQVGNAVPPLLAKRIGEIVHSLLKVSAAIEVSKQPPRLSAPSDITFPPREIEVEVSVPKATRAALQES